MESRLYTINLTKKYEPGMIDYSEYVNRIDGIPQWPDFAERGFSWEQYLKINKLLSIEGAIYRYNHIEEYGLEANEEEKEVCMELINAMIKEYDAMDVK
ncbi:MAG: hypothetical protein PUA92_01025 [Clostridium sp.]|nr:hypothetical protein [Clostridium sp.]